MWYVIDHSIVSGLYLYLQKPYSRLQVTAPSGYDLDQAVFLGRPWRGLARVMYQYSDLTSVVNPEGWSTLAANATP
jgi:hypothetical protein